MFLHTPPPPPPQLCSNLLVREQVGIDDIMLHVL